MSRADTEFWLRRWETGIRGKVSEHTSDKEVELKETGITFTNKGATGTVTFTLPSNAKGYKGVWYRFMVEAAQTLRIDPSDSLGFIIHGAQQTDGNWIQSGRIGDVVTVQANSDGDWLVHTDPVVEVSGEYIASSVDKRIAVATRPYQVLSAKLVPDSAGTDSGSVTAMVQKVASGTDIGSGTDVLASTLDLKGTVDTTQEATLHATVANRRLDEGDALALDFTGTLTDAAGLVTLELSTWQLQ